MAAGIYKRVNNNANYGSWLLPLEIFNFIVMVTGFVAAAIFAIQLNRLCLPLDEAWPILKTALSVVAPDLSDIFNSCPISMVGAALSGFIA